ncbi:hypothetical protein [Phocaeicola barnesiae]|uniref:hypothetical protein n=1 Tax=Phocaeicola barnesiae TaxID=376804 RepID=UPI0025A3C23A|nr:hypothetical protein [Phocaeicola barnesiae]MDM8253366.1 hypothetical protein [Phocaeicola barnesiae]
MELKIYDKYGNLRLTASPNSSSSLTEEVGGECSVSAVFTHTGFVPLDVDDYIEIDSVRYRIRNRYRPKQKNTQKYEYSVKFYAPIHDAEDAMMLFLEGDITSEFNYDGGPREHLQLWVDNMNRAAGENRWSIGTVVSAANKTIEYKNLKCWDAAFGSNGIAATFETEMWADGYVINLCRAERGERIELGYLQGLTNLAQEDNGEVKFFTRLFPLGSTRNIDASKYGYSRLQLPSRAKYVDQLTYLYGVKEHWEESAFSGIYPKYEGTVTSVRTEERENEEGRKYTVYFFTDSGMAFNPDDYAIPEYTYMLAFQTGELSGRGNEEGSFEAAWHNETKEWEIINVYPDSTTQLPGGVIIPQPGDKYIPWNFGLPQEYITAAEQAYEQAVYDFLASYNFDPNKYSGQTDRNYIERNSIRLYLGLNVRLLSEQYFSDTGYKDSRITRIVRKLNDLCQATITCCDKIGTGWKSSVDNQLENLQYIIARQAEQIIIDIIKTTDTKTPSDYNVLSALKAIGMFHRKDKTDSTTFLQRFLGGADFGQFTAGMVGGSGARIDQYGDGEMRSLKLRDSLTVPQITFNCIDVISGDKANSFAYGTIKSVDTDSMTAELDLLEGQWGTLHVNDFCRGTFHNLAGGNESEDKQDANGFWSYSGFSTAYFTPIEILENTAGTFRFRYSLQQGTSVHPIQGMNFFAYGNPTDKSRQSITYETRYYTRRLKDVTTWAINPTKNISMQDGLLDGLVIGGMEMSGYGTYSENNYFTGVQIQFTPEQEESLRGESAYGVVLSEYSGIVTLDENGNVITGFLELSDVYSGENDVYSGEGDVVVSNYRLKTRIQAFRGKEELYYSDTFGNGKFLVSVEPYGCTCIQQDGVVYITGVTDTNYAYVDIIVNCEGNAEFRQTYTLTFVKDGTTPVLIDLDNEMGSLTVDSLGNVTGGLPFSTTVRVYSGNDEIAVEGVTLDIPEGVTATTSGNVVTVQSVSASTPDRIQVGVNATYRYNGTLYIKSTTLTLAKISGGEDAVIYDLFPSVQCIKIEKDGSLSTAYISCQIKKVAGQSASFLQTLPEGLTVKFSIDGGTETVYDYRTNISCSIIKDSIRFYLYQGSQMLDAETVFVLSDGQDGEPGKDGADGAPGKDGQDGSPGKDGTDGKPGLSGCSTRESEWVVGREYRNDTDLEGVSVRFVDIALVRNDNLNTGWEAYICKRTHTSSTTLTYKNTTYWEQTSQNVASIFLTFLLAKNAKIRFLQSNELIITDSEGNPTTVLSGTVGGDKTRIAIGSTDIDNAPFRVNEKGEMHATKATIQGRVTATSGTFNGYVYAKGGSFENVMVSSITSKNGAFEIDHYGNVTISNLKALGGIFENITLKKSINTPDDNLYIDANGNVKLKNVSAEGGGFRDIRVYQAHIEGNIVTHANGNPLFTIGGNTEFKGFVVYGICSGANSSALIYSRQSYMKILPYSGALIPSDGGPVVTEEGIILLSLCGVLYDLANYENVSGFSEWLNSI